MKKLFAILITIFFATSAHAADTYKFDPNHTSIVWSVNHFGFSTPSGKFMDTKGTLVLDEKNPEKSKVEVTIPVTKVNSGVNELIIPARALSIFVSASGNKKAGMPFPHSPEMAINFQLLL